MGSAALLAEGGLVLALLALFVAVALLCARVRRVERAAAEAHTTLHTVLDGLARGRLVARVIGNVRDVTEHQRHQALLQDVGFRRETAREDDRKRIARRLHGELGQILWALRDRQSFGLIGLKERALMLRGRLEIGSAPGAGTRIELHASRF